MLLCYIAILKPWKNTLHSGTVLNPDRLKAVSIWSLAKISDRLDRPDGNAGDPGDRDRPHRPDRPLILLEHFHMIVPIAWTHFETIGAIGTIGAITWKPGRNL